MKRSLQLPRDISRRYRFFKFEELLLVQWCQSWVARTDKDGSIRVFE
jgi:hypothetical protein